MHAALVEEFSSPPRYREIPPPVPNPGESWSKFGPLR